MKKLFLALMLVMSSSALASAEKSPTWKYVEDYYNLNDNTSATIYYNPRNAQVLAETKRVLMWVLLDVSNEGSFTEFREYNCEKNKYRALKTIVYQLPMGEGNVLDTKVVKHSAEAPWIQITPETYEADLSKLACKYLNLPAIKQ